MKKINELVTSAEKPEHKAKRTAITFGSFKRAEEKQIQERKDREHQAELARIAEEAKLAMGSATATSAHEERKHRANKRGKEIIAKLTKEIAAKKKIPAKERKIGV